MSDERRRKEKPLEIDMPKLRDEVAAADAEVERAAAAAAVASERLEAALALRDGLHGQLALLDRYASRSLLEAVGVERDAP